MSTFHIVTEIPTGENSGSGRTAVLAVGKWLGLAASPTFAIMALWTAAFSAQPDMLCTAMRTAPAMSGMTLMYLLMSVFHLSPWLRLIVSGLNGTRRYVRSLG